MHKCGGWMLSDRGWRYVSADHVERGHTMITSALLRNYIVPADLGQTCTNALRRSGRNSNSLCTKLAERLRGGSRSWNGPEVCSWLQCHVEWAWCSELSPPVRISEMRLNSVCCQNYVFDERSSNYVNLTL
eukprot:351291-Chlamydomonas_euryale.AAC.8